MAALPAELAPEHQPLPLPQPQRRPQPVPAPAPRRRTSRSAAPRRRSGRYVVAMMLLAGMGIFGSVALNALAAEQSFAARELEAEVAELTRTADELTVDVTRLESPARLHRTAVRELGMVRATQPAFVVLPDAASKESRKQSRTMAASAAGD